MSCGYSAASLSKRLYAVRGRWRKAVRHAERNYLPLTAEGLAAHLSGCCYAGDADPSAAGGIAAIYSDLAADATRTAQVAADVAEALARGRHCLVLTSRIGHLDRLTHTLRECG